MLRGTSEIAAAGELLVLGNAGDAVTSIGQGWTLDVGGPVDIGGQDYALYTAGAARLLVDTDITQVLS